MFFLRNKIDLLKKFNYFASLLLYLPVFMVLFVSFTLVNIIAIPVAYVFAIYQKLFIIRNYWEAERNKLNAASDLSIFIVGGIFMLLFAALKDAVQFTQHAFATWKNKAIN